MSDTETPETSEESEVVDETKIPEASEESEVTGEEDTYQEIPKPRMPGMTESIASLVIGFVAFLVANTWAHGVLATPTVTTDWAVTSTVFIAVFASGIKWLDSLEAGVPLFIGQRISWYLIPPGLSWFPGGVEKVYIGQRTIDHRGKKLTGKDKDKEVDPEKPGPIHVLAKGHIDVFMSILIQYTVIDPFLYSRIKKADTAFAALMSRAARWFATHFSVDDLPGKCGEASAFIEGSDNTIHAGEKNIPYTKNIRGLARSLGIEIDAVIVDDYDIPDEIVNANVQKIVEEGQAVSEDTQMDTFVSLGKKLTGAFKISDEKALDYVQTERDKVLGITFSGERENVGDFTKGASVREAGQRERDKPDNNSEDN